MDFDRDAFISALRAAAQPRLVGVELPGIGRCWVRPLTAGDWMDSYTSISKHEAAGIEITPAIRMAVGLAQNLCGPEGEALFDVSSMDDLRVLAALPMDVVSAALAAAGQVNASTSETDDPNA